MMQYQIIFLKLQNFLYKLAKVTQNKQADQKSRLFLALKQKAFAHSLKPHRGILGAKKSKFSLTRLARLETTRRLQW